MLRSSLPSSKGRGRFVSPLLANTPVPAGSENRAPARDEVQTPAADDADKPSTASKSLDLAVKPPAPRSAPRPALHGPSAAARPARPLLAAPPTVPQKRPAPDDADEPADEHFYNVLWRKIQQKKHRTWDGDGVIVVKGKTYTLRDADGKELGKTTSSSWGKLKPGETITIAGKDVEVVSELDAGLYRSGRVFVAPQASPVKALPAPIKVTAYKNPSKDHDPGRSILAGEAKPRHNPQAPNALVMPRPSPEYAASNNPKHLPIVDVVVDPVLSGVLRQHQREGVKFLYEAVMGMRDYNGQGAILADEMGLGKTLQTISLCWTLLKQNPFHGNGPVAKRCLIVCPASLVANWNKEFLRWLGKERLRVFPVDGSADIKDFLVGRVYSVMIVGYEKMRLIADVLKAAQFDLVICDEGHRLKDPKIKTSQILSQLSTRRRVILSGTPIQNNLEELFSMIDFANPSVLGSYSTFKQVFEKPILAGRARDATASEKRLGEDRSQELARLTGLFILRRTAEVNAAYLPPKNTFILFLKGTALQSKLYDEVINSKLLKRCLDGSNEAGHLRAIAVLKKIATSPTLLTASPASGDDEDTGNSADDFIDNLQQSLSVLGAKPAYSSAWLRLCSSKLLITEALLSQIVGSTDEKVIIVSMSTLSLNVVEELCKARNWPVLRIDGSTQATKRQPIIDRFNSSDHPERILLLSSKSGGAGLNVVGASRMILLDLSWNPADDAQAMARIWREGQKRPVFIYRLCFTGSLEESQLMRQSEKSALSSAMMQDDQQSKAKQQRFSKEELRRIFSYDERTLSITHDALRCKCHLVEDDADEDTESLLTDDESVAANTEKKKGFSDLKEYRHLLLADADASQEAQQLLEEVFGDAVLGSALGATGGKAAVTAIFANTRNS
ncbi:rad54b protein [Hyaloraphidium curvatum]|nr:rad54b protein [Hyaloraphidium curvatum]